MLVLNFIQPYVSESTSAARAYTIVDKILKQNPRVIEPYASSGDNNEFIVWWNYDNLHLEIEFFPNGDNEVFFEDRTNQHTESCLKTFTGDSEIPGYLTEALQEFIFIN